MVITITMKNVVLRGATYHFRMAVPKECQQAVGKTEITQALDTGDPAEAAVLAKAATIGWRQRFKQLRHLAPGTTKANALPEAPVEDLRSSLHAYMEQHLASYLDGKTDDELRLASEWCTECMFVVRNNTGTGVDMTHELGIEWPLPAKHSPGMTRKLGRVVIEALGSIRQAIDVEAGKKLSEEVEARVLEPVPHVMLPTAIPATSAPTPKDEGVAEVARLMLDAKDIRGKFRDLVMVEAKCLQEWHPGKPDIAAFSKSDIVDYARNCLPYILKNMAMLEACKGKTLWECVGLTKAKASKVVPISHRTARLLAREHPATPWASSTHPCGGGSSRPCSRRGCSPEIRALRSSAGGRASGRPPARPPRRSTADTPTAGRPPAGRPRCRCGCNGHGRMSSSTPGNRSTIKIDVEPN